MGWSLGYLPPKEPELLRSFFLVVGKALYLSNAFEAKCKYVLRIAKIVTHYRRTQDVSATDYLLQTLKDNMLKKTITELKGFPEFKTTDIELLERAKDARNFVAHEGANIGDLSVASAKIILEQVDSLRQHIRVITAGDNVVSRWVYEIDEKEPAPIAIQKEYPDMIDNWLFCGIDELRCEGQRS